MQNLESPQLLPTFAGKITIAPIERDGRAFKFLVTYDGLTASERKQVDDFFASVHGRVTWRTEDQKVSFGEWYFSSESINWSADRHGAATMLWCRLKHKLAPKAANKGE